MPARAVRRGSLVRRLVTYLLPPLLLLGTVGAFLDARQARNLTQDARDQVLASIAIGLAARLETDRDHDLREHLHAQMAILGRTETEARLEFVVQSGEGTILAGNEGLLTVAAGGGAPDIVFESRRYQGVTLRVATYHYAGPDGRALIVVGEDERYGEHIAHRLVATSAWINAFTLLLIIVCVALAVRHAVRPLRTLSERVTAHEAANLRPLRLSGVQAEVLPLVRAINRLVATVRVAAEQRQTFLNQAAHQLRTPLAGLQAQVQLLIGRAHPQDALSLRGIEASVLRLIGTTQRMLSLARVSDEGASLTDMERVDLSDVLEEVASLRVDEAVRRDIDLGYEAESAVVQGVHWMLIELVLNLVDNALVHCPRGATVTVRAGMQAVGAAPATPFIQVVDDGPGIPAEDRQRVLGRFVRLNSGSEGSGLGLAIVDQIAQRHGATLDIASGPQDRGTSVTIRFPSGLPPPELVR